MPHTPSSDRATTRKPETAPPRIATWTASTRLRRAAAAVRRFDLDADEHADDAGRHRASRADEEREPVRNPRSTPKTSVSATSCGLDDGDDARR